VTTVCRRALLVVLANATLLTCAALLASAPAVLASALPFNPVSGSPFAVGNYPDAVALSPSGGLLAAANYFDATVSVLSVAGTGTLAQVAGSPFATGKGPLAAAFSPDGSRLACAGGFPDGLGEVKVWDMATGQETLTLKGHTSIVTCVAFSHDGARLASASTDGTVKVWDARPLDDESAIPGPARR
jgi:WD40 repeat protein